jgi:RHS repeat-associated protein
MKTLKSLLFTLTLLFATLGLDALGGAQTPVTVGNYPFQTVEQHEYDSINLADLGVVVSLPIRSKSGLIPATFVSSQQLQPVSPLNGFAYDPFQLQGTTLRFANILQVNNATYASVFNSYNCANGNPGGYYSAFKVISNDRGIHPLPSTFKLDDGRGCSAFPHYGTAVTTDNSGFTFVAAQTGGGIYLASGINNNRTDTNGNLIGWSETAVPSGCAYHYPPDCAYTDTYTDTLNSTVLTAAGTSWTGPVPPLSCNGLPVCINYGWYAIPSSFSYTNASGSAAAYTVNYSPYFFATAFACPNQPDTTGAAVSLPSSVSFPDGTSLSITYEHTPGYGTNYTTGRLASLTLPTGGQITYTYSGGTNGINCFDSSPATITRTEGSSSVSYTHAPQNFTPAAYTTVVNNNTSDKVVYTFERGNSQWLRTESQVYQGGTVLKSTTINCFNNDPDPNHCITNTPGVSLISQLTSYTQYPDSTGLASKADIFYDQYGNVTESDAYAFGAGAPGALLKQTLTTFGTWNGSSCVAIGSYINNRPCDQLEKMGTNVVAEIRSSYDPHGNKLSSSAWTGSTWLTQYTNYDSNGTVASTQGINVSSPDVTYTHGECNSGALTNVSNGIASISSDWDCNGAVIKSVTDPNSAVASVNYTSNGADPFWRPKTSADYNNVSSTYTYGTLSDEIKTGTYIDVASTIDGYGRPILAQTRQSSTSTYWDTTTTTYDLSGRPYSVSIPCAATLGQGCSTLFSTQTYDFLGRPLVSTKGNQTVTSSYYTSTSSLAAGVLTTLGPAPTGENSKKNQIEYDALGRVKSVCEILASGGSSCGQGQTASGYVTTYAYSSFAGGTQLTITQGVQSRVFKYDALHRLTYESNPETGVTQYFYDTATTDCGSASSKGDLTEKKYNSGAFVCYSYDSKHRVLSHKNNVDSTRACFVYDTVTSPPSGVTILNPVGNRVNAYTTTSATCNRTSLVTDEWFSYSPQYLTDVWESTPHSGGYYHTSVLLNDNGSLNTLSLLSPANNSNRIWQYSVDGEGRLNGMWAHNTIGSDRLLVQSATFNAASQPLSINYDTSTHDDYTYTDALGLLKTYALTFGNPNSKVITGTLTWNDNRTLQKLVTVDGAHAATSQTCTYGYDDLKRLTGYNCTGGTAWSQSFSYDRYGNTWKTGNSSWACVACYDAATNHYNATLSPSISYDSNGNLTNDTFHAYQWDGYLRVKTIDSTTIIYDADGNQVEQCTGSNCVEVLLSPLGKIGIMNGMTIVNLYLPGVNGAVRFNGSNSNYNLRHIDQTGTARQASTDNNLGTLYDRAFAPFGESYANTGSTDDLMFTGQTQDTVAGTYDFSLRKYNPNQSRWISPDPLGTAVMSLTAPQTFNRYSYAGNNPATATDASGGDWCDDSGCETTQAGSTSANYDWTFTVNSLDNFIYLDADGNNLFARDDASQLEDSITYSTDASAPVGGSDQPALNAPELGQDSNLFFSGGVSGGSITQAGVVPAHWYDAMGTYFRDSGGTVHPISEGVANPPFGPGGPEAVGGLAELTPGMAGSYSSLSEMGTVGDEIVAHHMPQAALGFTSRAEGGALTMTQAEHLMTRTWGPRGAATASAEAGVPFRTVLARDMRDVRGIVSSAYNQGMQKLIQYYRQYFPNLIAK